MFAKAFVKMSFSLPNVLARQVTCSVYQSFRIYFFTSNVLLIQVYLRSGNSQRLVAVVFPVYKLCMKKIYFKDYQYRRAV